MSKTKSKTKNKKEKKRWGLKKNAKYQKRWALSVTYSMSPKMEQWLRKINQ